ncbi:IMPACT family protein [Dyella sp.]|uniref:IMPACT family protein n=1 Tax=Dyella sp. TaxID=1869338 RepID=UPI003F8198A2
MSEALQALAGRCQHEQDIKKSRFLALAAPVDSPEEALAFVQEVSDPAATHNCWAYLIGQAYRFNDDGEPGGTAGRPILQAIEGQGIDHAVVVVTRWYGGIKLGAGGLARAYGGTAAECLRLAERVSIVPMATLALSCDFADLALLKARLPELEAILDSESFHAEGADLIVRLPQARVDEALTRITDLTRGRSLVRRAD